VGSALVSRRRNGSNIDLLNRRTRSCVRQTKMTVVAIGLTRVARPAVPTWMLEHASLWISAPTATWPPGLPRTGELLRWVLDSETRSPLGHTAIRSGRWWPWPASKRIAAYEAPDSSLLFTVRRAGLLRRSFVIADADGHPAAFVRGPYVIDRTGRFVGYRQRPGLFVGPFGVEVARWHRDGLATSITFGNAVRDEPFAKMGLLGAMLMDG
jgi:hypothetical protein